MGFPQMNQDLAMKKQILWLADSFGEIKWV